MIDITVPVHLPFRHIGSFHNVSKWAHKTLTSNAPESLKQSLQDTIRYIGTVKLHGTSFQVQCHRGYFVPQSRNQALVGDSGHYGSVDWLQDLRVIEAIREVEQDIRLRFNLHEDTPLILCGEWCGGNVQKKVALQELPKQWVLFQAAVPNLNHIPGHDSPLTYLHHTAIQPFGGRYKDRDVALFSIKDVSTWSLDICWSSTESVNAAIQKVNEWTLAVEQECPWAAQSHYGVHGIGEGIVWVPEGPELLNVTELCFKSKGHEHKRHNKPVLKQDPARLNPERLSSVQQFVEFAMSPDRLEQGLEVMCANGVALELKNIKVFLDWVSADVRRECADELEASGLSWKDVEKIVTRNSAVFFREQVQRTNVYA